MSTSIDQAFIKQFEAEVHVAYQRMGTKLRDTIRVKNGVNGSSTTFQKVGRGTAGTKARHGLVPVMNVDHTPIECILSDHYAGDWVDKLDELKINIDERKVLADAGAYALGRKTDELITTVMDTTTTEAGSGVDGLTKAKALEAFEILNTNDVPDDGNRFSVVGPIQWNELLNIDEFANADYIGAGDLPWKRATSAKEWLGMKWFMFSGLPVATSVRKCFMYHRSSIGHAVGQDVMTDITWHGDRAAHFVSNCMSQGSCLIDVEGIVEMPCLES